MKDTSGIKITSWNVNGLGSYVKRRKILGYLKLKNADVVMLQEPHLLGKDANRIQDKWIDKVYHNSFSEKRRGVSILFSKKISVEVQKKYEESEGRVLMLLVNISGKKLILGNIYAPNLKDPDFFLQLKRIILDLGDYPVILGGDFN